MSNEIWQQSASDLAGAIRSGRLSSREVVEAHLARIEAVNDRLNAVTVVLAESALAAADAADQGEARGPLHGVPFTVNENIDCVGSATTQGLPALAEAMPSVDAPVVARMKAAGAIPIARTNLPEMGLRITTDNPLRGRTLNPWNAERTAGGSSGGEGSALASGMSPIGLGNDIGGSLRNPAFCCGITSLKPSAGRIPHASCLPPVDGGVALQVMCVEGPMARHVEDLRLALGILSGRDPRDPVSVDAPLEGLPAPKKAALVTEIEGGSLADSAREAVLEAGRALEDSGWEVSEAQPPELERVSEIWAHVMNMDFQPMLEQLSLVMSDRLVKALQSTFEDFDFSPLQVLQTHTERNRLSRVWSDFFQQYPVVVGPTWTDIQFHHDADLEIPDGMQVVMNRLRFITPANVLGLPSVAVPTGVQDGLPTGVQVYAEKWREDLALGGAEVIEAALGQISPIDPLF